MGIIADSVLQTINEMIKNGEADYNRLPESLRKALSGIDSHYSLNPFTEVDLNLPSSLGLEKLSYTEKNDDELYSLAKDYLASAYQSSFDKIGNDYLKNINTANIKKDTESQNLEAKLLKAEESALNEKQKTEHDTIKRGLSRSSIKEETLKDIDTDTKNKKGELSAETEVKLNELNKQIENLGEQKLDALRSLDIEHALKLDAKINELVKQENTAQEAVIKYNNSVDEKEATYQRQLQSAYDAAIKAKNDNNKRLMELGASLGDNYVSDLKQQDKLESVKNFIAGSGMSAEEALEFVSSDYLFKKELGLKHFAALEDWINGKKA